MEREKEDKVDLLLARQSGQDESIDVFLLQ